MFIFFFYFLVFFNCYHFSVDLHFSAQPLEAETAGIMTLKQWKLNANQCKKYIYMNIFKDEKVFL